MPYSDPEKGMTQAIPRPVKTYHTETYDRISPTKFDGKGKTLFITGGATGIGLEHSRAFAQAGIDRLIIVARSQGPLDKAKQEFSEAHPNLKVSTYSASVADNARMTEILKEVGPIDILVSNAAYFQDMKGANKDLPVIEMQKTFDTNVVGPFHLLTEYINGPVPASGKKVYITVSSGAGQAIAPHQVAYGPSKAAFGQVITHVANEIAADPSIRIFNIHPGAIYTDAAASAIPKDMFPWEDEKLPAHFATWIAGGEGDFLHGKWLWAQWDVDELLALKERVEKDPTFLTIGLVQ